ncbi:MAG: hypothetical protein JHC85_15795, partial [Chthoniobacterales bacterium]|nr:hypothetical protein [Chthoniobacterales bacterium]
MTMTNVQGQIAPGVAATVNGSSTLTLFGDNTLAGLALNNAGGGALATVNTGGTLTLTGGITATSTNPSTIAMLGGTLDFGGSGASILVSPIQFNGVTVAPWTPALLVSAVVQNAGTLSVSGGGVLQLSGASTFAGGYSLAGDTGLAMGASSTPTAAGTLVTAGPLGTGTLRLQSGATLLASSAFTVANPMTLQGTLNFAGANSLVLNGALALGAGTSAFNTAVAGSILTLGGKLSGADVSLLK